MGELDLWHLDQRILDRGIHVDTSLVEAVIEAVRAEEAKLLACVAELTGGAVVSSRQIQASRGWLAEQGLEMEQLTKAAVTSALKRDIPPKARTFLEIRQKLGKTSVSKYKRILDTAHKDRLHGMLQFNGAIKTGRWAGRLVQMQNLPRPTRGQDEIDVAVKAFESGSIDVMFDDVMSVASDCIRAMFVAGPGKKLVVSDLSNIEGRILPWLTGDEWKLDAFTAFDEGTGPDLYKVAYGRAFNVSPETVDKDQRAIGKVMELALGYQGGVGAFATMAAGYNMDLDAMAEKVFGAGPPRDEISKSEFFAKKVYEAKKNPYGMPIRTFVACNILKRLWRAAHPATVAFWGNIQRACFNVLDARETVEWVKEVKVFYVEPFLIIQPPSGRRVCYPYPEVEEITEEHRRITYMGLDQFTNKWSRLRTYGGKLTENIVQHEARMVMAANMPAIDKAGYKIVLSVHDELVTEAKKDETYTPEKLSDMLATNAAWNKGLPLAAAGYEAERYRKD